MNIFTGLNNSLTNESTDEEVRRLRFENLILQSKVDTLEAENKSLKEVVKYLINFLFS